jgi:glycosyltransferase involved in cell wall biosynthesis/tetratricopeptide (TPR) repeat protein
MPSDGEGRGPARGSLVANDEDRFLVSAIVSTFNSERFFRGCIEDLLRQTLFGQGRLEIVVVDSGSEQGEGTMVRRFQEDFPNIVYRRTERESLYAAWNRAVGLARGRYLTAANTDDRHRVDALETMARVLESTEVGLVYSDVLVTQVANETFEHNTAETVWQLPDHSLRQALVHCPYGSKYMWARTVHEAIGLFDPAYTSAGDYEFFLRLASEQGAYRIPQALGLYYESLQNISYRDQDLVVREVNRFLPERRNAAALEDIYSFLKSDCSAASLGAALVDWGNQLAWSSVYPDLKASEELYRRAETLHRGYAPGIRNNLALLLYRAGRAAEAVALLEQAAPQFEPAGHNLREIRSGVAKPSLRLFVVPHAGIQAMTPVVTPQGRRVPLADYRASEAALEEVLRGASLVRRPCPQGLPVAAPARIEKDLAPGASADFSGDNLSVVWLAPIFNSSGYAEEARSFIHQLDKLGVNLAARSIAAASDKFRQQMNPWERSRFDELIQKPVSRPMAMVMHGPGYILEPLQDCDCSIGRTMFEAQGLPSDWVARCNTMDEIWVPTHEAIETFRAAGVRSPLVWIPEGMDTDRFRPGGNPLPIPGLRGTVFLSVFEWSWRKGWDVLLKAWAETFHADDDVCLVLRTYPMNSPEGSNAKVVIDGRIEEFLKKSLGKRRHEVAPIILLPDQIPDADLPRLFAVADAYVAPSRGEGWGRPQMAAMACGLPTIATRWGGTLEFMTPENSLLVDCRMVLADERSELPFYRGLRWADPSSDHLAERMRQVARDPKGAALVGTRARQDVVRLWQWGRAAGLAAERFREVGKRLGCKVVHDGSIQSTRPGSAALRVLLTVAAVDCSPGGSVNPGVVAEELVRRGHDVSVLYAAGTHPSSRTPYFLEETTSPGGVRLFGVYNGPVTGCDPENPDRETLDPEMIRCFGEVIERCKPGLVHFHTFQGLTLALAAEAKRKGLVTIYSPHNYHLIDPALYLLGADLSAWTGTDFFRNSEWVARRPDLRGAYARRAEAGRAVLNEHLDLTLAGSYRARDLFEDFCGRHGRIAVVHQGYPGSERVPGEVGGESGRTGPLRVGFLGPVVPREGLHILAAALQRVSPGGVEAHVFGVVDAAYKEQVMAVDGRRVIRWRGAIEPEALGAIAKETDLVVVPSLWEAGAGSEIVAALFVGRPVVAARVGSAADFVVDGFNGRLYRSDSIDELAEILEELVRDRALVERLRRNCRLPHAFGDYVDHVVSIYHRLLKGERVLPGTASLVFPSSPTKPLPQSEPAGGGAASAPADLAEAMHHPLDLLFARASSDLESGNLAAARNVLIEILAQAPDSFEARVSLGSVLFHLEDFEGSWVHYDRALSLEKDDAGLRVQAALVCLKLGRMSDFERVIEQALKLEPEHVGALKLLGDLNLQEGRFVDAGRCYSRILSREPGNCDILIALGVSFFKGGDLEMAKAVFGQVLVREPEHALAKENLEVIRRSMEQGAGSGAPVPQAPPEEVDSAAKEILELIESADRHFEEGRYFDAKEHLLKVLQLSPDDIRALTSLAAVADALGDVAGSRHYLQEALRVKGEDADLYLQWALVELKQDDVERFEELLAKAFAVDPKHHASLKLLADLNFRSDRLKAAAESYTTILTHYPDDVEAMVSLGACFMNDGDLETARMVLTRALELDASCASAKEHLETIASRLGDTGARPGASGSAVDSQDGPKTAPETIQPAVSKKKNSERVQELVDEADFFSEVGNLEASLETLERALELAPRDMGLLSAVGSLHYTMGDYEASRAKFRNVIEFKPRDPEAYTRLAMACLRLDRIEEMEAALGIALEIDPENREALKFLAKTNLEAERVRDAGRAYAKLLEEQPDDMESLLALGLCFFKGGDLPAARMVYGRVLEYDRENPTAVENLAQIDARENRSTPKRGKSEAEEARERSGKVNELMAAAEGAFKAKNLPAARDALKNAVELAPNAIELLAALGSLHFQLDEMPEAREVLCRLVELAPAEPAKWVQLALTHYQLNEIEDFEKALKRALELDPDHFEALRLLAHMSFKHGNFRDAAQTYGRILKRAPNDVEILSALGVCFFKGGDMDAARMMFEKVLEVEPGNAIARENLGVIEKRSEGDPAGASAPNVSNPGNQGEGGASGEPASKRMERVDELLVDADRCATSGDVSGACDRLRKACELEPETHEIHAALGSLLYQLGQWDAGVASLKRATQLAPNSADYHTRLAISLLSVDSVGEFEEALQKALTLDPSHRPALRLLADLNLRGGNFKDAAHTYHRLLLQTPDDVDVMLPMAVCFYKNGDPQAARMVFNRILTLDPEHAIARENRDLLDREASGATAAGDSSRASGTAVAPDSVSVPAVGKVSVLWEGSQFVHHSLALVNRELCFQLLHMGHEVSILPYEPDQFGVEMDPRFVRLAKAVRAPLSKAPEIHVRHQWPFNPVPPKEGRWVVIQPWEYGVLPKEWLPVLREQVDEIWTYTNFVRDTYIRSGVPAEKVFVVPCGVDPDRFHPGASPAKLATQKKYKFLFVGGLIHRKGIDLLLNTYMNRFRASDDVCLVIKAFGSGWYRDDKVRAQIKKIQQTPGSPEILLLDRDMEPAELPGLYTACDCLVHPYRGEGFGLPVLEAMACELPVIVTGGGSTDDFATDELASRVASVRKNLGTRVMDLELAGEGWLLEPDPADLGERMTWIVNHPDEARAMARRASLVVRAEWSWSTAASRAEARLRALSKCNELPVRFISQPKQSASGQNPGTAVEKAVGDERSSGKEPRSASAGNGVDVVWEGPQFSHHSLALINREVCLSLIAGGTAVSVQSVGDKVFGAEADPRFQELEKRMNGVGPSASALRVRHQWPMNLEPPLDGPWIVMQPWEFGAIPRDWLEPMQHRVDEIWAYTEFVRQTYIQCGVPPEKVFVIPCGVHPGKFHPGVPRANLATHKKFKFLFVGGTILRKGPDVLLNAYLRTFTDKDDVCLVIKDFGGRDVYKGQTIERSIREAQARSGAPEILHLTEDMTPDELPGLYGACDCLVHPYRGEGFGLPVLEAMAVGLPVIVTEGGSTDDFAPANVAYRIPSKSVEVPNWAGPELVGSPTWLEPDQGVLEQRMRAVFQDPEAGRRMGRAASAHVHQSWTWDCAATRVLERLKSLASRTELPVRFQGQGMIPPSLIPGGNAEIKVPAAGEVGSLEKVHALVEKRKFLKAWNATLDAIRQRPFHPDAYLQMVDIALRAEDIRQALACAERLIRMTPNWTTARQIHDSLKKERKPKKSKVRWTPLPKPGARPSLSVCLIVRNEEEHIGRCLASVKDIATQIVVVDTGSSDRTVAIAKEYGAEVYHFEWNDDFSDARNEGHQHARGDWVLILDADEELPVESHKQLLEDMAVENVLGYRIPICNIHEADDSVTYVPRLFRNAPALFFVGRVHEQIYASVIARKSEWNMEAVLGTARINHYGYDPGLVKRRQKVRRNLRLLERAIQEMPNEAALVMNYGLDLVNDGRLEEGLVQYRNAVRIMEPHKPDAILPEVRERLLTIFGVHLLRADRFEEVVQVMTSRLANDCGPTASLHFLAAAGLMKLDRPAEAIPHLQACLAKRGQPTLTPPCKQVFRGGPRHLLAECFCKTKQVAEAEEAFKEGLKEDPDSVGLLRDYAYFLHKSERSLEAMQVLHQFLGSGVDDEHIWHLGCLISNSRPEFAEFASDWTAEAIKFHPEHPGIVRARGEALLKAGELRESVPFFKKAPHREEPDALAAVVLAELGAGDPVSGVGSANEADVSREFIAWYRRLLATKAQKAVRAINGKLEILAGVLPTASRMLKQALEEAGSPE